MREEFVPDHRLSAGIAAGDMGALAEAYARFSPMIYRQALAIVRSSADAEDVVQDVFLKLVRRSGPPIKDLRFYLLGAARNEAYTLLRHREREVAGYDEERLIDASPMAADPDELAAIREALDALPPEQREVVVMKVCEQMTLEEIGAVVHASANTVASRYRYAMQKLRATLGGATHV